MVKKNGGGSAPGSRQSGTAEGLLAVVAAFMVAFSPASAHAQPVTTPSSHTNTAAAVTHLRVAIDAIAQRVDAAERAVQAAVRCPEGHTLIRVRLPRSRVVVQVCATSNPSGSVISQEDETALVRQDRRVQSMEAALRALRDRVTAIEAVEERFLPECRDGQAQCEAAAEDARQRLGAAYDGMTRLMAWALQQDAWNRAAVTEFERLQHEATDTRIGLQDLERWQRETVTPTLAALQTAVNQVRSSGQRTADLLQQAHNHRVTLGPFAQLLYIGGAGPGVSWLGGVAGLDFLGRPFATARSLVVGGRFSLGYGDTVHGVDRGALLFGLEAAAGHEWGRGRLLLTLGGGGLVSTRWRETFLQMTGGVGARGEYDLVPGISAYLDAAWRWGNGVDPQTGGSSDVSRWQVGAGVRVNLGNWGSW